MPDEQQGAPGLSKEQKIGVLLLSVFAIFAVGLGVLQIRNTMYAPFALNKTVPPLDEEKSRVEALRYRDTDKDGLNDFDEVYVYSTSAYLEDTDSDGINDKDEISKGSDPNCGEGKDCAVFSANSDAVPVGPGNNITSSPPVAPEFDISAVLNDAAQLRKLLEENGMDKQALDAMSDKDLLLMAQETLSNSSTTLELPQ